MDTEVLNMPVKSKSSISCCRACLATEGKMFDMHEHKLVKEFVRVTGIPVKHTLYEHILPQHLCSWCASVLQRCAAFRAKCLRAKICLEQHLSKGHVTTDSVKTIDRLAYQLVDLTRTEVDIIDSTETALIQITQAPILPTMKKVLNTDNAVEKVVKNNLYLEINPENKNELQFSLVKEKDMNELKAEDEFEVEYLDYDDDDVNLPDIEIINTEMPEVETGTEKNIVPQERQNAKNIVKEVRKPKKNAEYLVKETRKRGAGLRRLAENNYMPLIDFAEFESAHDVKVFTLTEAEQKAELEERRASVEYQRARLKCVPCGKPFKHDQAYNNHVAKHAKNAGPYPCSVCTLRYRVRSKRTLHVDNTHRFKIVCNKCGFISRSRSQAKLHHEWHGGKMFQCDYCGLKFSKLSTYFGHLKLVHPTKNVACTMCGEPFVSDTGLRYHMARVHAVVRDQKRMQCQTCSITFASLNALRTHKEGEHTAHSCSLCGENFHSEDSLEAHAERHPTCLECAATFLNEAAHAWHVQRKHLGRTLSAAAAWPRALRPPRPPRLPGAPRAPRPPRDPGAPRAPRRPRGPRGPRKPRAPRDPHAPRPPPRPRAFCEICGKLFMNPTLLRFHQASAHNIGELPFACELCQKRFPSNAHVKHHMRVHTGERPYQCDLCDLRFALKSNLIRHMLVVHLGKRKQVPCELCGRVLSCRFAVQLHVRSVHMGQPAPPRTRTSTRTRTQAQAQAPARAQLRKSTTD